MKISLKFLTIVLTVFLLAGTASAIPLNGDAAIVGISFDEFDWTTIDVLPALNGNIIGLGDLSGLSGEITLASFDFVNPSTPAADPLWSKDGFTFVLDTVSISERNDNFLNLIGTGTMRAAGFDDSPGAWTLTLTSLNESMFSFASTAAVPEPATLFLLGSGMIGMVAINRRKLKR